MAIHAFIAMLHTGKWLRVILAALACVMALISTSHIYTKAFFDNRFDNQRWGLDFYQFWYGGHFFWQGEEPYSSIQHDDKEPDAPTYFIDGHGKDSESRLHRRWKVSVIPGAAPLFLLMAPLSLLSWVNASIAWSVMNVALGAILVWLLVRLNGGKLASAEGMLLLGMFFSTIATRQTIELGQTSLIVTASMFGALLLGNGHPIIAGTLLAISISKYTVGFPLFLYFMYRRWLRGIASCIASHLLGIVVLAAVGKVSPFQVVRAYISSSASVLQQTAGYSIHLFALEWGLIAYLLVGASTIVVLWALIVWHRKSTSAIREDMLTALTLIGICSLWSLLSLYHGRQDMVAAFTFLALVILRAGNDRARNFPACYYQLTAVQKNLLYIFTIFVFLVWSLPLYALIGNIAYRWLYAACNIGVLVTLVALLFKIQQPVTQSQQ
ncbi:MAG: glycosyltransferase family 87 protein [Anaerolineae bacterium]